MIQIRNVPDPIHCVLKARAKKTGMSLSDYLLNELKRVVSRPTLDELRKRFETRSSVILTEQPTDVLRRERDRQ